MKSNRKLVHRGIPVGVIVAFVIYVSAYLIAYQIVGLAQVPFGSVKHSQLLLIPTNLDRTGQEEWDFSDASSVDTRPDQSGEEFLRKVFWPARKLDVLIRTAAFELGCSDYALWESDDGSVFVMWDE